jgi:HSP20 family protein
VEGTWLHRESRGLDYRRTFELDPIIDTNRISASIEHGVLRVRLPKAEQVKPRRIKISE